MAEKISNDALSQERAHTTGKATSIKHPPSRTGADALRCAVPDFRNLGAVLRIFVLVNLLLLLTTLMRVPDLASVGRQFIVLASRVELPLLVAMLTVYLLGSWMARLTWRELTLMLCSLAVILAILTQSAFVPAMNSESYLLHMLWAIGAALAVSAYFRWRQISQIPALDEARILALTARIRPHFFFNSLNGVLGVIRSDPRRAEQALESLAELFRELMKDNRDLVTLCDEIELCNRYLELERLRLGDRLQVNWELKHAPLNAKVPPLMLQPLLENAVYHGIEPSPDPGVILVRVVRKGHMLEINMINPSHGIPRRGQGNRMALDNIRERLVLFFDMEASLMTEDRDGQFRVRIRMPLRKDDK